MSTRTLLLALAGVIAVVEGARPLAQTPTTRLADARVLGSPIVTLDLPANDATSSAAIQRVLEAAGVRYGFEGGALPIGTPPIDFGQVPSETLTLTGLTVGAALDAIARANPHVHWTEANGAILARTTPDGQGILAQRLPRFVVVDASPRVLLDTLVHALDPTRPVSTIGMGRPPAGRAGQPPARTGNNVTIALENPTVLDLLDAAMRQDTALSWSMTYAAAPASAQNATIEMSESGELAISSPPETVVPTTGIVPVSGDLLPMLMQYLRIAPVQIGIEQIAPTPPPVSRFVPPLYLGGVSPRDAIARIVAYDSRYEWSEDGGVFHVRPKARPLGASLLDRTLPSFVRNRQATKDVIVELITSVARATPRTSFSPIMSSSPARGSLDAVGTAPINLSLPGPVSLRDVLDAICRAAGGISWVLRGSPAINDGWMTYTLQLMTTDGIALSEMFTTTAETVPSRPPAHPLPPSFAQINVGAVYFSIDQPGNPFAGLAASGEVPMGVELLPRVGQIDDPRFVRRGGPATRVGPGSFANATYALMERLPDYEFFADGDVIDVAPSRVLHDSAHFMNRPLGRFDVTDMPTRDVICLLRRRMNAAAPLAGPCEPGSAAPSLALLGPAGAALDRHLSLALDNPTPRDVLNAIVGAHHDLTWLVTYEGRTPVELADIREENAVIALGTFFGGSTIPERFVPYRDPGVSTPSPTPPPPSVPSIRRGLSQAIELPATWRSVEMALQRLTTVMHVAFGVEGVVEAGARPTSSPLSDYYDLTGLPVADALAKVGELGGAIWTEDRGVYHVRAKALAAATALPLDRRVDHFEQQLPDARAALQAVRALVTNQQLPSATFSTTTSMNGASAPPVIGHPISVNMSNVTVREILDEMVRQFGDAGWFATYVNANGTYPEIQFHFAGSTWSSSTTIPIR